MFLLECLLLGIILGLIFSGNLFFPVYALPRRAWLAAILFLVWLLFGFIEQDAMYLRLICLTAYTIIIVLFIFSNKTQVWPYFLLCGSILNGVVAVMNDLHMPISGNAINIWGGLSNVSPDTDVNFLIGGRVLVQPWPWTIAISIGDILIGLSIIILIITMMRTAVDTVKVESLRGINIRKLH